jgi:DNA-binding transcriptional LysR family regulator
MNYTLHQLDIFIKVCEYQSITKASEAMHLTQSAVSIQLKKLQNQFDIPLTEVIGRQLYITDFGKKIEKLAVDILEKAELIKVARDEYKGVLTGQIRIASVSTGKYVIPYFLTKFTREYPGVQLLIDVTNKGKVIEVLQQNRTDFGIVSVIPENLSLNAVPLMNNELHLVGEKSYLDSKKKVTLKRLQEHPLIFRENGSATKNAMMNFLNKNNIQSERSMELVSNEAVKQAVRAGLGLSIMPLIGMKGEISRGKIQTIPMKGLPIVTEWNLVYGSGKNLSPAALALVNHIKTHKEEIIKTHFS